MKIRGMRNKKISTISWNILKYPSKCHVEFGFRNWQYWSNSHTLYNVALFCMIFSILWVPQNVEYKFRCLSGAKYLGNSDILFDCL
jgi:hypothetical protein